jgi:hypothetical protein
MKETEVAAALSLTERTVRRDRAWSTPQDLVFAGWQGGWVGQSIWVETALRRSALAAKSTTTDLIARATYVRKCERSGI